MEHRGGRDGDTTVDQGFHPAIAFWGTPICVPFRGWVLFFMSAASRAGRPERGWIGRADDNLPEQVRQYHCLHGFGR